MSARVSEDDPIVSDAASPAGSGLPYVSTVSSLPTGVSFMPPYAPRRRQIFGPLPNQLFGLVCWMRKDPGGQWKMRTLTCLILMGCTAKDSSPSLTDTPG